MNGQSLAALLSAMALPRLTLAQSDTAAPSRSLPALALDLRERFAEVIAGAANFPSEFMATLMHSSPTGLAVWHLEVLLYGVLFVLVGYGMARISDTWTRGRFFYLFTPTPGNRQERLTYLLLRTVLMTLNVAIYAAVAMALVFVFDAGTPQARQTQMVMIAAVGVAWLVHIVLLNLLAPDTPSHRLVNIDDSGAQSLHRAILAVAIISLVAMSLCTWMLIYGLNHEAHLLLLIGSTLLTAVLLSLVCVAYRRRVAAIMLGPGEEQEKSIARRLLAGNWHVLAVLYFMGAWAVSAARLLLGLPSALGLVFGPLLAMLAAVALYAVLLLVIEIVAARLRGPDEAQGEPAEPSEPAQKRHPLHALADSIVAVVAWASGFWLLLVLWGVDVNSGESLLVRMSDVIVVAAIAYIGYQVLKISIDRKIEEEGGYEVAEPGEEASGGAASRLATLLPLFRNFALITVLVIAGMIFLSQIGVDIAPLFAGAGVIGLAVGFGAQALIRDIFSGAFFLIDDAFRLGEYIDLGGTKGTVERISIRSMQMRHHLGALHTVPFGEIKQITNYSRDWAMMKLELRVTYDTDVEKLRKLIKNLGQELAEDPELGPLFLQPLKSQGVKAMEDSAMIMRVKFMTQPGEQFVLRKVVYARLREMFAREGIKFAHREVTVRMAGDEKGEEPAALPPGVAGAAARAVDDAAVAG